MICPYCAAGRARWMNDGQYWHRADFGRLTPREGAKPITIPAPPPGGDVPDRVACKEGKV